MYIKSFALVAALFGSAIAAPAAHVLHEKREVESTTFVKRSAVPVGRALPVRIGLQQSNLDIAHDLLMEM
jgi:tripeptidyl-peptidase-1